MRNITETDSPALQRQGALVRQYILGPEQSIQLGELKAVLKGQLGEVAQAQATLSRVDQYLGAMPPMQPFACKKGCTMCCHYRVRVRAQEAFVLVAWLHQAPPTAKERVLQNLRANAKRIAQLTPQEHLVTNLACPFLDEDAGECSAYEVRPLACRRHHSLDVSPCQATFEDPLATDQCSWDPLHLMVCDAVEMAATESSKATGVDARYYELTTGVLAAFENPASLKRWRNGKVSFPGAVRDAPQLD